MEERTLLDEQPTPLVEEASEAPKSEHAPESLKRRRWERFFKIIGGIVSALFLCFCILIAIGYWYENRWPKPNSALDTWDFGRNGAKGVTLPFTFTGGMIHIQGFIGTHPTRFLVDTGAYASNIPKRLHLGTQYANDSISFDANGATISTRPVFVPNVRIGSLTIFNFSAQVPVRYATSNRNLSGTAVDECILGNSALSHVVVTINYPQHLITFQPPQSRRVPQRSLNETMYKYTWLERDNADGNYAPIIKGKSYSHHLNVLFDTGTSDVYEISPSLESDLIHNTNTSLTKRKVESQTAYGSMMTLLTKPTVVTFPSDVPKRAITLRLYARAASVCSDPTSAVIGGYIFRRYIVTIDYPNRTITFRFSKAS